MIDFQRAKQALNSLARYENSAEQSRRDVVDALFEAMGLLDLIASMHSSFGAALHTPTNNLDRAYWLAVQEILYPAAPEAAE